MADNGCLEPTLAKLAKEKKKWQSFGQSSNAILD